MTNQSQSASNTSNSAQTRLNLKTLEEPRPGEWNIVVSSGFSPRAAAQSIGHDKSFFAAVLS